MLSVRINTIQNILKVTISGNVGDEFFYRLGYKLKNLTHIY